LHRIHDPIYGYIEISDYERKLIDTLLFQRLRGIHQQGTAYLTYPSSKHDRFSHSLGTMKIATDFLYSFARVGGPEFRSEIFPLMKRAVRITCLYHDIGHGPFSHASDRIFQMNLSEEDKKEMAKLQIHSPHELFSYRIIKDFLPEYLNYIETEYNKFVDEQKEPYVTFQDLKKTLEVSGPLFFDGRPEKELKFYLGGNERKLLCWRAFKQIIDCDFDSDKIDYIQRDGYITGVKVGHLDTLGLLNNLLIDYTINNDNEEIGDVIFDRPAMSAIETLVLERYKLFKWLNFHHTVCFSDELISQVMELSIKEAFDDGAFTYDTFNTLAQEDLKALKSGGTYQPYNINLLDDFSVIFNVKKAFKECNSNPELKLARYYLNIIESRQFFTGIWRVDSLLEPEQERILSRFKKEIDKEQNNYVPFLQGLVKPIEFEIANEFKVNKNDVIITYKPFEPVKPNINIRIKTDEGIKNIRDVSSIISLLEWRRRIRPADLKKMIFKITDKSIGKKKSEDLNALLIEELEDAPQIFTPIYVFIKDFPRDSRIKAKGKIFKIIEKSLPN